MICGMSCRQIAIVWELNRLRRTLMLTVLAWANSLHDPATYARSYSGRDLGSRSSISALIGEAQASASQTPLYVLLCGGLTSSTRSLLNPSITFCCS